MSDICSHRFVTSLLTYGKGLVLSRGHVPEKNQDTPSKLRKEVHENINQCPQGQMAAFHH